MHLNRGRIWLGGLAGGVVWTLWSFLVGKYVITDARYVAAQNAGLFLKALQASAPELKNLIRPHLGNGLAYGQSVRMSTLLTSAPQLEARRTDQIAALPLGGRIRLDPWTSRVELLKTKPIALTSANEKLPFEVTPFFPYLTRLSTGTSDKVALTTPSPTATPAPEQK